MEKHDPFKPVDKERIIAIGQGAPCSAYEETQIRILDRKGLALEKVLDLLHEISQPIYYPPNTAAMTIKSQFESYVGRDQTLAKMAIREIEEALK